MTESTDPFAAYGGEVRVLEYLEALRERDLRQVRDVAMWAMFEEGRA